MSGGANVLSTADTLVGAGDLNRRVTIQQFSDTSDGQGGTTRAWNNVITVWAHIEPWKGTEKFLANQVYPNLFVRVLLRYQPSQNITAAMRLVYGSRTFNIRSVSVLAEARTTIELLCEELQAAGSLH